MLERVGIMKILHIVPAETSYMYSFLKMMNWTADWEDEHIYYAMLSRENAIKRFPKLLAMKELIYLEDGGREIDKRLKKMLKVADKIIWHSLVRVPVRYKRYLNKHSNIMHKSYWSMCVTEIEYFQKREIEAEKNKDYWLDSLVKKLKIISPCDLFHGIIKKYALDVMEGEYPYPYRYNNMVESILVDGLNKKDINVELAQIGFSASIANEHNLILEAFESKKQQEKRRYCIPMSYAKYPIGSQVDLENTKRIEECLRQQKCEVIYMNNVVSSYNYLLYLRHVKEIYIGEIPATAVETLVYLGYLDRKIYYFGKNEKLKNFSFNEWAKKELDIESNRAQWRKLFALMRES